MPASERWDLAICPNCGGGLTTYVEGDECLMCSSTRKPKVVEVMPSQDAGASATWLASDEAFEVAWRGAEVCGVGSMSPARLTAALTALSIHLRSQEGS